MLPHFCPRCRQPFEEAGFCPHDGTPLVPVASPDQQTVLSVAMPAQRPSAAVESVSASTNRAEAIQQMRAHRATGNEYDRLVGQTLDGRYFVERKIGEGGMGVVYAARHAVIERPLAIKVLKREATRDIATVRRFVQEAKAASRIGHPNIVDVTDFGTTPDGMTYSVMEFVAGQTLGAAIRHGAPMLATRALKITTQLARALGAAHDKGIVHRDLKPENVFLVDRDGRTDFVKIVDFGIAKVTPIEGTPNALEPRLTRAGSVFGTPEYMAPEQAAGRSDTDGRVDVYALGVILYEMLTGRVPHRGESMVRTLAMQMLDPAEPPSKVRPDAGISRELEAIVMRCLEKKREMRFQTMAELIGAIESVQPQVGVSLTGSPVFALSPLPPGASPDHVAEPAAATIPEVTGTLYQQPVTVDAPSRPRSPTNRRLKNEPEFVTQRPPTFDHVFADDAPPPSRRRGVWFVLVALALAGAGVAIALVLRSAPDAPAAAPPRDAAIVVTTEPSDAPIEQADAPPADASAVVELPRDAGRITLKPMPRDAGDVALRIDPTRPIRIRVAPTVEGARFYQGTTYRGSGNVMLEEPYGTVLELECRNVGYKPGRAHLVFDGKTETVPCVMERIKVCIDGIKNPFDDCEVAPPPAP